MPNPSQHWEITVRVVVDPGDEPEGTVSSILRADFDYALQEGMTIEGTGLTVQECRVHSIKRTA